MSRSPTWYQPFWQPDAQRSTHQDAFDLLQLAGKDLRDLPIQARKAYLKEVLRTLFRGYLGSTGKTPDLLCLEESFSEWLHS
jgi:hypothetical protein